VTVFCNTGRSIRLKGHRALVSLPMKAMLKNWLLVALVLPLSGCYYLQAAQGQMALLAKRQPITKVLANPHTDAKVRARLDEAQSARIFAVRELGLPDNQSYASYVDVRRRYVLWNVFAAPEFSVNPIQWCFPIAGCVVYRGYFSEAAAERFARKLRREGLDATTGGVPAYSTLGHFNDPLLSTMLNWSDAQLAATLFHELAHQVAYTPGESAFNEAFATTVENEGLQRWLRAQKRPDEWRRWQIQQRRQRDFSALLLATRNDLQTLYASRLSKPLMRERKQQRLGQLKFEYQQLKLKWQTQGMASNAYDAWFNRTLSNADFVAVATYESCVPAFERLLASVDNQLPRFYAAVKQLIKDRRQAHWCTADES
jgi:predicted aminopeptidase